MKRQELLFVSYENATIRIKQAEISANGGCIAVGLLLKWAKAKQELEEYVMNSITPKRI